MADLPIATGAGGTTKVSDGDLRAFESGLSGRTVTGASADYDEVRALWNAMIDRRPALIVQCESPEDVQRAVGFVRENGLLASVRGAGHNIAGKASCDDGVMIDLSPMKEVSVDADARTARVGAGATLAEMDAATQAVGLATPLGINSTTGVAGLTLGGGFGWLTRKYGMTVDNLLSADVVMADGERVRTSETEEPDLFWGVRGGGGNLGIVTSFEFRLHPVGPEVLSGLIVHPFDAARDVIRHWRSFALDAPDEASAWIVARKAPPLPFLPEEWHGREVLVIAVLYSGDMKEGEKAFEPLRSYGEPIADVVQPHPYAGFQQAFDPLLTPGARNYWKSHNFVELPDAALDIILDNVPKLPSPQSEIFVASLGGAASRVAPDATAYPHRDANFVMNVHTRWEDPARDDACVAWAREFFDATAPYATGGVYVNFISEGEDRVQGAYGANYERLAKLKARYDPSNLFSQNQNVRPSA